MSELSAIPSEKTDVSRTPEESSETLTSSSAAGSGSTDGSTEAVQVEKAGDEEEDGDDDAVGLFEDSLYSLFGHHQPATGDPGGVLTYRSPYGPLKVRVSAHTDTRLFAHFQWDSGLFLADMISSGVVPVKGKNVLELGAGTGLPGILTVLGGSQMTVLSDYDEPNLLENIRGNVRNCVPEDLLDRTAVVGHIWGESTEGFVRYTPRLFNLILLADCIWMPDQHHNLLSSLSRLLDREDPSARVLVVAGFHSGRLCVQRFLERAAGVGVGLEVDERGVEEVSVDGRRRRWPVVGGGEGEGELDHGERGKWKVVCWLRWKEGAGFKGMPGLELGHGTVGPD